LSKELEIVIPCEPGKIGEHLKGPIYVYDGKDSMNAYKCPHCGQTGPRRKPMERHMGLVMNIPAGCRILKAEDQRRRDELKKYFDETREAVTENLSDALWMLREQAKINAQRED